MGQNPTDWCGCYSRKHRSEHRRYKDRDGAIDVHAGKRVHHSLGCRCVPRRSDSALRNRRRASKPAATHPTASLAASAASASASTIVSSTTAPARTSTPTVASATSVSAAVSASASSASQTAAVAYIAFSIASASAVAYIASSGASASAAADTTTAFASASTSYLLRKRKLAALLRSGCCLSMVARQLHEPCHRARTTHVQTSGVCGCN